MVHTKAIFYIQDTKVIVSVVSRNICKKSIPCSIKIKQLSIIHSRYVDKHAIYKSRNVIIMEFKKTITVIRKKKGKGL